jgi:hypothetical protein
MQTDVDGLRNNGMCPADRCVFADDDFALSMTTDRPETIQREKPTAEGIENFSLISTHASQPATVTPTTGYYGQFVMVKISSIR